MGHNTPFGILPNTSHKVPPTCTDSGEKGDEALSLAAQIYFFRVMRMRFVKLYIHVVQKKITTILVLQAVHMMQIRNTGFSPQKNIWWCRGSWTWSIVFYGLSNKNLLGEAIKWRQVKVSIESGKLSVNCGVMKTKRCNTEVWVTLEGRIRSQDCKLQEFEKLLAASASHIVQASSELTKQLVSSKQPTVDLFDVKVPLTLLKNALSLAAKLNQSINPLRGSFIKPSLPAQYARLADIADDS